MTHRPTAKPSICHCGSGALPVDCCQPIIQGKKVAATAKALMRSRYTAYVELNENYLLRSWHPDSRPLKLALDPDRHWLGLKILRTHLGLPDDAHGQVEFVARSKLNGRGQRLHERSNFVRMGTHWFYLDGQTFEKNK